MNLKQFFSRLLVVTKRCKLIYPPYLKWTDLAGLCLSAVKAPRWIKSLVTQSAGWINSRLGLPLCPTWPCFPPSNGPEGNQSYRTWWSGVCCEEQWLTPSWFYLADILGPRGVLPLCQLFILPVTLCNCYRETSRERERKDSLEAMGADWDQVIEFHLTIDLLNYSRSLTCTTHYNGQFHLYNQYLNWDKKVPVLYSSLYTMQL